MAYIAPETIHERSLLMARNEAEVLLNNPEVGEIIYHIWCQMDASEPELYCIEEWYEDFTSEYTYDDVVLLFESIRQIICRYDDLIDEIVKNQAS